MNSDRYLWKGGDFVILESSKDRKKPEPMNVDDDEVVEKKESENNEQSKKPKKEVTKSQR